MDSSHSSSGATRRELENYILDMQGSKALTRMDYEQVKNLFHHLCIRMGIANKWTDNYGDYLTGEAFTVHKENFELIDLDTKKRHEIVLELPEVNSLLNDLMLRPLLDARHPKKCIVLGGGAYGTAITSVLARKGHRVEIVMLDSEHNIVDAINNTHRNTQSFPDIPLHPFLVSACTETNLKQAVDSAEYILLAVPVQFVTGYLTKHKEILQAANLPLVCVSKGIDAKTSRFLSELIPEVLPGISCAFLAGPSFAKRMMLREPTCVTVASEDVKLARAVQILFSSPIFRVFITDDVWGVEVGSALKNVLAIACGVLQGLGYGPNTQMAMVTRGWADIRTLSRVYGGREETMTGLAGIGDVMLTCFGGLSRNAKFGNCLAKNNDVERALKEVNMTVEGYFTSFSIKKIARKRNLRLPVLEAITDMLGGKLPPNLLATHIMALPLSFEESNASVVTSKL